MKYTGLKDQNVLKEFKKDLIIADGNNGSEDGYPSESIDVVFADGQWCWRKQGNAIPLVELDESELNIIGNIDENPELLN